MKKINKRYSINYKRVYFNLLIIFSILFTLTIIINNAEGSKQIETKSVVICPSDTLWDIAKTTCKNKDVKIQSCVSQIKKINNLENSNVYVGQTIEVPIY